MVDQQHYGPVDCRRGSFDDAVAAEPATPWELFGLAVIEGCDHSSFPPRAVNLEVLLGPPSDQPWTLGEAGRIDPRRQQWRPLRQLAKVRAHKSEGAQLGHRRVG